MSLLAQAPTGGGRIRAVGDWFLVPRPQSGSGFRLFCFPHAGGDATAYIPLATALDPVAEVWALRMPARGGRRRHPMPAQFRRLVDDVVEALTPHLGVPFGFYGQSFGALLAYEVAQALPVRCRPRLLVTASAQPPSAWEGGAPAELLAEDLLRLAGMGHLIGTDAELRRLALETIRTDLAVRATYRYRPAAPLSTALHAVVGRDDPMLDAPAIAGWEDHVRGPFGLTVVPGGHLLAGVDAPGPAGLLSSLITGRSEAGGPPARPLTPATAEEDPCSPLRSI
ncbi:thioesterase II family protein [Actinacidiphila rubida]|uniref:Surfactin synthase thioesterase subunit n=1 Tax=Actinacidiphila rubida TaxID=310780 RepID=A0A1H8KAG7_9ACTN|nr:thioesterase domain-containing protein [Actinacidiphila rubida]SEN89943.1 Surfactin synthase thioesterase subunit [Actinacidiphila rubida]